MPKKKGLNLIKKHFDTFTKGIRKLHTIDKNHFTKSISLKCQSLNFQRSDVLSLGVIEGFRAAKRHKETISSHKRDADA